ncbi:Dinitrogenase iron-molybdenum cofactor biosynthesis protein [Ammonifex degensii KC4]|uniref:Dinitrogenase iron-molybdenum cofactor biosynthesis protein n=1 Tax=Ammonifex degensii (strain DSM 10501 / KC4) TaxID=429009 RepID=C9RD86_AMMDK|nr:NifB/NifX family molybdenum-iron cluster-binding protein [Ammonifex degensii]ACX52213.1 Dinitrogenase iron-molybdenum cofactor biosynthesis protein [Ammonifex degensii KC4]
MKVAVSATGQGTEALVDPRFGRCPYFVIYDTDSGSYYAVPNPAQAAGGGAGIQAAQTIVAQGVSAVITGNLGPNAFQVLAAAGIKCYVGAGGTVQEAIEAFRQGKLSLASSATAPPHAGGGWGGGRGGCGGGGQGRGRW